MKGGAAAHHGIEDDFALQPTRGVVITTLTVEHKLLEYSAKRGPTPSRPPFVQIRVWAKEVLIKHFTSGEFINEFLREGMINREAVLSLRRAK